MGPFLVFPSGSPPQKRGETCVLPPAVSYRADACPGKGAESSTSWCVGSRTLGAHAGTCWCFRTFRPSFRGCATVLDGFEDAFRLRKRQDAILPNAPQY